MWQSMPVGWRRTSAGFRPPAHPPTHRLEPLRGRLAPLPPVFPGWTPGMPCVACLRGHPADAVPLRTPSLRSVAWGSANPRLRRTPPRFAWAPYGRPDGGLAALPHLATSPHPPSLHSAALHFGRSDAPSCHCPPFGRPRIRSALTAATSLPSSLRSVGQAVSGFDSLPFLHSAALRSGRSATSP